MSQEWYPAGSLGMDLQSWYSHQGQINDMSSWSREYWTGVITVLSLSVFNTHLFLHPTTLSEHPQWAQVLG